MDFFFCLLANPTWRSNLTMSVLTKLSLLTLGIKTGWCSTALGVCSIGFCLCCIVIRLISMVWYKYLVKRIDTLLYQCCFKRFISFYDSYDTPLGFAFHGTILFFA